MLKTLDHPNILKIYEFYQDENAVFIIMEICTGGELFDKIIEQGSLFEQDAGLIIKQLLEGLAYSHKKGIAHRDIKPENILLDILPDGTIIVKIIDWGCAHSFMVNKQKGVKMSKFCGTHQYMAPEVFGKSYDEKCDVWSAGVVLFILLTGMPPFYGRNEQ